MGSLPVTLIVKAPNQQIEDQTIKCELSWTINKLKQHLQEVYPSKPPKHEQKLIYSGQLLNDSVILKDVLRQYDGQETHTVHLVCSSRHIQPKKQRTPPPQPAMPDTSTSTHPPPSNSNSETRIPPGNMPLPNGAGFDPNYYALHMTWMQQAYMQYLTQQYMNVAANNPEAVRNFQMPFQSNTNPVAPHHNAPQVQQEAAPQQPQVLQPPPPAVQRDPENPERDWLDVFYMLSRVMLLFTVVYFYSSPLRFIFVLFLGFGLYLYQIGFFRNINNNNNNNNLAPPEPVLQEVQIPSRLMVVWTMFTTFFASLIPEIPNAV